MRRFLGSNRSLFLKIAVAASAVSLFSLARRMGTCVEMIDRTYGHLAPDAEEYERGLLDAYDETQATTEAVM